MTLLVFLVTSIQVFFHKGHKPKEKRVEFTSSEFIFGNNCYVATLYSDKTVFDRLNDYVML